MLLAGKVLLVILHFSLQQQHPPSFCAMLHTWLGRGLLDLNGFLWLSGFCLGSANHRIQQKGRKQKLKECEV
jgi:hypothetical protein